MLESLAAAIAGLQQLLTWPTPGYLLAGVLIGYVVGILPGLGASAALAFLLPAVVSLAPIDGTRPDDRDIGGGRHRRRHYVHSARRAGRSHCRGDCRRRPRPGRARRGPLRVGRRDQCVDDGALFGMGVLVAFVPFAPRVLANVGSPELAALAIVGICLLVPLSHADPVKGLFSGALGLALATVGLDPFRAEPRFTFAQLTLRMAWDCCRLRSAFLRWLKRSP